MEEGDLCGEITVSADECGGQQAIGNSSISGTSGSGARRSGTGGGGACWCGMSGGGARCSGTGGGGAHCRNE